MTNQYQGVNDPYFIFVSMGRCGTTLLQHIVNSHPGLFMSDECHWFGGLNHAGLLYHQFVEADDLSINSIPTSSSWWLGVKAMHAELFSSQADKKWGLQVIGKHNKDIVFLLLELYPKAKVVFLQRDPRDLYLSLVRTGIGHRSAATDLAELRTKISSSGRSCFQLSYEQLCSEPESVLFSLCQFLGVEYVSVMMQPLSIPVSHAQTAALAKDEDGQFQVRKEVSTRWLTQLKPEELMLLNHQYHAFYQLDYPLWNGQGKLFVSKDAAKAMPLCYGFTIDFSSASYQADVVIFTINVNSVGVIAIAKTQAIALLFREKKYKWTDSNTLPVQLIDFRDIDVESFTAVVPHHHKNYKEVRSLASIATQLNGKELWLYSAGNETKSFLEATQLRALFSVAGILDISARIKTFCQLDVIPVHSVSPSCNAVVLIPSISHYRAARQELEYAGWVFAENMFLVQ